MYCKVFTPGYTGLETQHSEESSLVSDVLEILALIHVGLVTLDSEESSLVLVVLEGSFSGHEGSDSEIPVLFRQLFPYLFMDMLA
jgi:hypothetical protein